MQYLAHQSLFVYSPEALKKWGKDMVKHPVGTGPFKLETWEPGVKVVLVRNDDYWGGAPKVRQAIYVPIIEAQARLAAIKTGEIDLTMDVPPDSLDDLRKDPNVVVAESNSSAAWYIALNTRHPILKDKRVRQALNYAVNKDAIIRDILKGTAIVSRGPLSPVYGPYHEESVQKYPYDLEKAKALLKEAGHAGGFELTFLVPESGSGMQSPVEMATVIQANLAAVGVKAKIQTLEWGAYLKKYLEAPDMAEMSWNPSIGDPDHMMYMLLSSDRFPPAFNAGFYQNDKVDDLLRKGRTTARREGARAALPRGAEGGRRGRAVDLRGPRQAGDHLPQARAGLQAAPELRSRAHAGVAAVGGGGLQGYVVRRLLLAVPVLFGVSLLVFAVMHLAPGDPAAIMLGAQATREDVERLHRELGLDRPLAGAVRAVAGPRACRATSAARFPSGARSCPRCSRASARR